MKKIKIVTLLFLLIITGCKNATNDDNEFATTAVPATPTVTVTTKAATLTDTEFSFSFVDTSIFDKKYLSNGTYKCGTDFEPGDYYILSLYGAGTMYDVSDSPNGFSYGYNINSRFIHAENGQYVKLRDALLIPIDDIDTSSPTRYGTFFVGEDIPSGTYKMESLNLDYANTDYNVSISKPQASYQVNDLDGNIVNANLLFGDQDYIELTDNQYITINNLRLTMVN